MKKKFLFSLLPIMMMGLFSSCNNDDENDHAFNYINLEFYEEFSVDGPELIFNFSTVETFPCSNFTIDVNVTPTPGYTEMEISDIDVPDVCVTAIGPATQIVSMGPSSSSTTKYSIWVNNKRHDFHLITEDHKISVSQNQPFDNHLFFAADSLMRIPPGTVWGYILYNNTEKAAEIWNQILLAFEEVGIEEMKLPDGHFHFFQIKDEEVIYPNVKQEAQTFYFHFDQPLQVLIEIYENILEQNQQPGVQLRLFDTKGERYVL
jgi:hypothetical protein